MQDRVPVNPGRVLITPENGFSAYYATITRADNPTQEGTPLNKNSLLKDSTATLLGLPSTAVPDDALQALKNYIDSQTKIEFGGYTGTGKYGSGNAKSLTFGFVPKFVFIYAPAFANTRYENYFAFFSVAQLSSSYKDYAYVVFYNSSSTLKVEYSSQYAKISGNTLSWYYNSSNQIPHLDVNGCQYRYIAFG